MREIFELCQHGQKIPIYQPVLPGKVEAERHKREQAVRSYDEADYTCERIFMLRAFFEPLPPGAEEQRHGRIEGKNIDAPFSERRGEKNESGN